MIGNLRYISGKRRLNDLNQYNNYFLLTKYIVGFAERFQKAYQTMYEYMPSETSGLLNRYRAIYYIRDVFSYIYESAEIATQLQEVYIRQDENLSQYQESFR